MDAVTKYKQYYTMKRRCTECKQFKLLDNFSPDRSTKDGISVVCSDCCEVIKEEVEYLRSKYGVDYSG